MVRRIAYWSRPAGLEEDRLSDLSPFLRVGVRGALGGAWGEGVDEGPIVWEGLRGGARNTSQSQHQDGQPHDWHLGSSAIRTTAHAATLEGPGVIGWRRAGPLRPQTSDLRLEISDLRQRTGFGGSRSEGGGVLGCASEQTSTMRRDLRG